MFMCVRVRILFAGFVCEVVVCFCLTRELKCKTGETRACSAYSGQSDI